LTADGQGLLAPRELAEQIYDLALLRELVSVGRNLVNSALDTSESRRSDGSDRPGRSRAVQSGRRRFGASEAQGFAMATRPRWA
jgi:replicative DNA helicase